MSANDIAFAAVWSHVFEIDITPDQPSATFARVASGISSVTPNLSETTSDDTYLDSEGVQSSDVTGVQLSMEFSGHREYGDKAQDFIAGLMLETGQGRKTNFRWTQPNGDKLSGKVTLKDIKPGGGDAANKNDFGFTAAFEGRPDFDVANKNTFPDAITATDVTVKVGETAPIGATVTPATASDSFVYGIEDDEIAKVNPDGVITGIKAGETNASIKSAAKPTVRKVITVTVTD